MSKKQEVNSKEIEKINKKIRKITEKETKAMQKKEEKDRKEMEKALRKANDKKRKQLKKEEKENRKKAKTENKLKAPWYSSYGNIPKHFNYPNYSLYEMIYRTSLQYPKNISYNYYGTKVTYSQFIKQIDEASKSFKQIGINKGDKVTICMPNTPEAIISFYALNKIGAIANMVHPLSSENEIKYFLEVSESVAIVAINIAVEKISHIIDETSVKYSIIVSPRDSMPTTLGMGYYITKGRKVKTPKKMRYLMSWKQFIEIGKQYHQDCNEHTKANYPAAILYSGGTTGKSKGIVLTNLNFNAVAITGAASCEVFGPGDTLLAIMPVFHGFGLGICIHTVQTVGGTSILLPQFSARDFHKLILKYKPNIIAGVPTLWEALLKNKNLKGADLSFIKNVISGGDSLSVSLKHRIDDFLHEHKANVQVREGYGLTESTTGVCLTPKDMYKEGSIGIPYPDTYFKIVIPNTQIEVPYGTDGEICISGPTIMSEYLKEPKETEHTLQLHEDGHIWLHTGDLGCMDNQGWIYFKQRLKRMIVSSGYNIYPQSIENVIDQHPLVLMSTVIGIPHPYKVQVAKAYIVLEKGIEPTEEVKKSIYEHCKKNIAKFSMPYEFEYRSSLPKTKVGKVAYTVLEEESKNKQNK